MIEDRLAARFVPLSGYFDAPVKSLPPLTDAVACDVVVIGGGWTGLAAALKLRQLGVDTVLIEQRHCGHGASGRSGGHLVGPGKEAMGFFAKPGEQTAAYVRYITNMVDLVESYIEKYAIDCEYVDTGNLYGATHPGMVEPMKGFAAAGNAAGFPMEYFDEAECRRRGLPAAFIGGAFIAHGGSLNVGKYLLGLRAAALAEGVRIFENSPVVSIDEGEKVVVTTPEGSVAARRLIIAAGSFAPKTLKRYGRAVATIRLAAMETKPLSAADLDRIGWKGRENLVSMHNVIESYRITPRNTIVTAVKKIGLPYGNAMPEHYDPKIFAPLARALGERLPELRDVEIDSCWGGWCALTPDTLPRVGVSGARSNIFYATGYNGHGVAPSAAIGHAMASAAAGNGSPDFAFLSGMQASWPPDPVKWLGIRTAIGAMAYKDARIDRDLRHG